MKTHTIKSGMILTALALAMLLTLASLFLLTTLSSVNSARADSSGSGPWVITANISATISLVNTTDNIVYGPFLEGQLGPAGYLLDVAITRDGKTALVSNFGDSAVYFVDISNPISPSLIVSVTLPMFAEDIALTHDGKFALVTDGGFSNLVASINLISRTLVYSLDVSPLDAQAVETAPDGTIMIADFFGGQLGTLAIDDSGKLTSVMSYTTEWSSPVNFGVAPDGQTVIVCNAISPTVRIYQITSPGNLTYRMTVSGIPTGTQSVAFNAAGDKAYVVSSSGVPTQALSVLDINAPGDVSLNTAAAADLLGEGTGGFFGVDVIAVVGDKAYIGNLSDWNAIPALRMVDLDDYSVTFLPLNPEDYPIGVAVIPSRIYLPLIFKNFAPGPDLVIDSLTATSSTITVTIRNAGNAATPDDFWVDVYFNPNPAPPGLNQPWQSSALAGANWGVTARLDPDQSLTLVTGGAYYANGSSSFPAGANVYAYVDSINYATSYGNILESNEGNNVFGPVISTAGVAGAVAPHGKPVSLEGLPER